MDKTLIVHRTIQIQTDPESLWHALTDRETIKQYFFGTEAISDWKVGSTLIFQGEAEGKKYRDKGNIVAVDEGKFLQYNYWSGWSGLEDREENYSLVTYRLESTESGTSLHLTQEGFANKEVHDHAEEGWDMVLSNLKELLEKG